MSGIIRSMVKLAFPRSTLKPSQPLRQTRNDPGQPRVNHSGVISKPSRPVKLTKPKPVKPPRPVDPVDPVDPVKPIPRQE